MKQNKRILFLGIGFYDYDLIIKESLEKNGYIVDYFCETPRYNFFYKIANKLHLNNFLKKYNSKYFNFIAEQCSDDYDFIFVIKGNLISKDALNKIKVKNKKAKFILYLWDSIERVDNFKNINELFDKVYSFDRVDCINYKLEFKPLFYRDEYNSKTSKEIEKYDLFFIGWNHSDRLFLLERIEGLMNDNKLKVKFLLFTSKINYFLNYFNNIRNKFLIYKTIKSKDVVKYSLESKAILDLSHPNQTGLTMRTIEVIFGLEKKLITTNKDILNYDFYDENNILVIDRDNLEIPKSFYNKKFNKYHKIRDKYYIDNWIKDFFI